jgi:excisionase family DNA binding protein
MRVAEMMEMQTQSLDPLLTIRGVSEFLNFKRTKIYELIASGDLIAVKVDRSTRIQRSDLKRYLETARPAVFRKSA